MLHYTDDPVADSAARDEDFERWMKSRPICDWCGEHILGKWMYLIDSETVCEDCINEHRHCVDADV